MRNFPWDGGGMELAPQKLIKKHVKTFSLCSKSKCEKNKIIPSKGIRTSIRFPESMPHFDLVKTA